MTTGPIEPLTGHSFSGWSGIHGPNSLTKVEQEREFPPLVPVQVSTPVTIVGNAVASSSRLTLEDLPATAPLVERIASPIIEERVQPEQCPQNKKNRTRHGKKAKKEAVHPAPIDPSIERNVVVFPEVPVSESDCAFLYMQYELNNSPQMDFSNPIDENSEHMFVPPVLNHNNPHSGNEVNPQFKRATFYQHLNLYIDQMEDPYLDDVTDCPDDISSGSEDEEERPSAVRQRPQYPWRQRGYTPPLDISARGWEDNLDNEMFFDMGPNRRHRYEYLYSSTATTNSNQLLAAIDSVVSSSIENINHVSHAINCVKCAQGKNSIEILADSGASLHLTNLRSDLCEYEEIEVVPLETASAHSSLKAVGRGAMFISTSVLCKGKEMEQIIRLYPVFYVKGLMHRYLSVGTLLNQGLELRGSLSELQFRNHKQNRLEFVCKPHEPGETIYWLSAKLASADSLLAKLVVKTADYDIMHRRFAHPSKDVLRHASGNTQGFPSVLFPNKDPICPGCAEGKMTQSSFLHSNKRAEKPFEKVHMDLKSLPTCSYSGYEYFLIIFDDCTSYGWTINLRLKSDAAMAIKQFIAMVQTQYSSSVKTVQTDAGGEFKSQELSEFLLNLGIRTLTSVPHAHQQNSHAEHVRGHP